MTQPNSNPEGGDEDLLRRLVEAPATAVEAASVKLERYSEDDDASDKRKSRADVRRTFHKIKIFFFWFLFYLVCTVLLTLSIGYIYLVGLWVSNLIWDTPIHNATALKNFIDSVLWSLLIVFATLFFENTLKDDG